MSSGWEAERRGGGVGVGNRAGFQSPGPLLSPLATASLSVCQGAGCVEEENPKGKQEGTKTMNESL